MSNCGSFLPAFAISVIALTGCSGPADETPVSLQPGLYEVNVGSFGAKGETKLCFAASDDENVNKMARNAFYFLYECTHKKGERAGNAISGQVNCPLNQSMGWETTYSGTVDTQSLTLDAKIVNYVKAEASESGEAKEIVTNGTYKAIRIGDC